MQKTFFILIWKHGLGDRNEWGDKLLEFCQHCGNNEHLDWIASAKPLYIDFSITCTQQNSMQPNWLHSG